MNAVVIKLFCLTVSRLSGSYHLCQLRMLLGQVFGLAVKLLFETPVSHIRVPEFDLAPIPHSGFLLTQTLEGSHEG